MVFFTVLSRNKKSVSVKLNKKSITLKKGKSYYLKASLKPANSTDTVKWKSSDKKVASVDSYGCIKVEDVAVIFAVPDFFPFILPFFTDTTEGFELLQARVSVV